MAAAPVEGHLTGGNAARVRGAQAGQERLVLQQQATHAAVDQADCRALRARAKPRATSDTTAHAKRAILVPRDAGMLKQVHCRKSGVL